MLESLIIPFLLFLFKLLIVAFVVLFLLSAAAGIFGRKKSVVNEPQIKITRRRDDFAKLKMKLLAYAWSGAELKKWKKQEKISAKKQAKEKTSRPRLYVLDFKGDMQAKKIKYLKKLISLLLEVLTKDDEVLIRIASPGGSVIGYGQAAAELARIKDHKTKLTAAIDQIGASGGYLMAAVAHKIIAAPFAIVGSIGVVAQVPNFHQLLKKKGY